MSMVCQLLSVQRRRVSLHRMFATAIILLSRIRSRSLVSLLISTAVLHLKLIISLLLTSSRNFMMKVNWWRRRVSNFMILRLSSSWQTVMWWVLVLSVATLMLMAISVRSVVLTSVQWSLLILTLLSLVLSLRWRKPRTGICLWTTIRSGWSSGFLKTTRSGVQTCMDSVRAG